MRINIFVQPLCEAVWFVYTACGICTSYVVREPYRSVQRVYEKAVCSRVVDMEQ